MVQRTEIKLDYRPQLGDVVNGLRVFVHYGYKGEKTKNMIFNGLHDIHGIEATHFIDLGVWGNDNYEMMGLI